MFMNMYKMCRNNININTVETNTFLFIYNQIINTLKVNI